jgi:hypothetical protein
MSRARDTKHGLCPVCRKQIYTRLHNSGPGYVILVALCDCGTPTTKTSFPPPKSRLESRDQHVQAAKNHAENRAVFRDGYDTAWADMRAFIQAKEKGGVS